MTKPAELVERKRAANRIARLKKDAERGTRNGKVVVEYDQLMEFLADFDTNATLIQSQADEIERLREALKPFADCADYYAPDRCSMEERVIDIRSFSTRGETRARLFRGDFRRARTALGVDDE